MTKPRVRLNEDINIARAVDNAIVRLLVIA